ncbi:MAG: site-2 protease family protein [Verrucomicrobia bacterium]|nr:MAG: site-2 protease family protein [Verrucomicrobiota bacterium]
MNLFLSKAWDDPFFFGAWVLIIAFSICVHEYAHAYVALRLGDYTAAGAGHLTLNPFKQMGLSSLIALLLVGIAWGAVPVDPRQLRSRRAAAAVAFAGPAANLLLATLSALLWAVLVRFDLLDGEAGHPARFLHYGCLANSVLFLFNLLPVPMFDGWSVFALAFPAMLNIAASTAQTISWIFLAVLFGSPAGNLIWLYGQVLAGGLVRGAAALCGVG